MSTETPGVDGGSSVHPYDCENAKEYAIERLREGDGPVKAAELASEYECSPGHMRDVLREASEVERVSRGLYTLSTEDDVTESSTEIDRPSADGPRLSPVTDTTAGGPDNDESEGVECPVEGCEYEGDDLLSLRGHANSVMDHDWEEVRNEVEKDMETEEAIERQRKMVVDEHDQDDGDGVDDRDDEGDEETVEEVEEIEASSGGMPNIPVEAVIAVAVVAFVAWWLFFRSDSSTEQQQEEQGQQDILGVDSGLI